MYEEYFKHISKDVTEEIKKFVYDEVFGDKEYLFVTKVNGESQGYCSKCSNEYGVSNLKHNERGICPICGAELTVKLTRYGRKKCLNEACFYYFEKSIIDPNVIVCKGYYVTKDYSIDYKNPKEGYSLEAIYIFQNKKAIMLKKGYGYYWSERSSIFDFNQGWFARMMCYCSFESIEKTIQGTTFQYIPYKMFQEHYSMVKLFQEYSKHPWIEQIIKIGFEDIVKAKLEGQHMYNCLNYRGKDLFKILKLSRKDVKEIKKFSEYITPLFLSIYQLQVKDKSGLSIEEIKIVEDYFGYDYTKLKNILKYTTMKKAVKYMEKQYKKYSKKFYGKSDVTATWSDYIDDCIKLNADLSSEHVLYPKDVHEAHQNTISQIKIKENKKYDKQIKKRANGLKKYIFEYNGLLIRPALSSRELIEESASLNHCVATNYTKPYANGETNILLIRKADEENKPYFTLELRRGTIIQVHGKRNCNPNNEVEKFIEAFKEERLGKQNRKIAKTA